MPAEPGASLACSSVETLVFYFRMCPGPRDAQRLPASLTFKSRLRVYFSGLSPVTVVGLLPWLT